MVLRHCETLQNLFIPEETENNCLKSHSQPEFLYQLEQDCGIKANKKVGRDAFYKKRFSWQWVNPRSASLFNARRDWKPALSKQFLVEMPRETILLFLPPDFDFYPFGFLVVGGRSRKKCQGNPAWLEAHLDILG